MSEVLGTWVAPTLMIPGMALLVISTANRYSQLLIFLASNPATPGLSCQLGRLRVALAALYGGIGILAVASLLAGVLNSDLAAAARLMLVLSCIGVALLALACGILVLDVLRSPEPRP